jgi:acetyl esterase/lipase
LNAPWSKGQWCVALAFVGAGLALSVHGDEPRSNPATPNKSANKAPVPPAHRLPTLANVPYGDHRLQVLDLWQAASTRPTPLVFFIHGGGWVGGDKRNATDVERYLNAGISVVSVNYRFTPEAQLAGVHPPVRWPLADVKRALQFVRHRAAEWNIDPTRIAASGSSAGACTSLWLAFHDDMAERGSADPVSRESTRVYCAAVTIAQTSLDPRQMKEWTPNSRYGGGAFGFMDPKNLATRDTRFADFLAARDELWPWIRQYSPYAWVTPDDPPVYLWYPTPPDVGREQDDPTHTANFGAKLQERLRQARVDCELVYPGAPGVTHPTVADFLIARLRPAR